MLVVLSSLLCRLAVKVIGLEKGVLLFPSCYAQGNKVSSGVCSVGNHNVEKMHVVLTLDISGGGRYMETNET